MAGLQQFVACAMAAERVVIDSGYLIESLLPTKREYKHQADRLMEAMRDGQVQGLVPYLFFHELAAVCARKQRARHVQADDVEAFMESVESCGFELDLTIMGPLDLYRQAIRIGCQAADAVYVELARVGNASLATIDGGMRQAAAALGVDLFEV